MRKIVERIQLAIGQNPSILVHRKDLYSSEGFSEDYLVSLGLTRSDLKRLERGGLAVRGRTDNGSIVPIYNAKEEVVGYKRAFKSGSRVRWILIADRGEDGQGTDVGRNKISDGTVAADDSGRDESVRVGELQTQASEASGTESGGNQ